MYEKEILRMIRLAGNIQDLNAKCKSFLSKNNIYYFPAILGSLSYESMRFVSLEFGLNKNSLSKIYDKLVIFSNANRAFSTIEISLAFAIRITKYLLSIIQKEIEQNESEPIDQIYVFSA